MLSKKFNSRYSVNAYFTGKVSHLYSLSEMLFFFGSGEFNFWSDLFSVPFTRLEISFTVTAPFSNMRTLKFKAQPTNAFFATVNQMFGGSSQLPTILFELCSTI